MRLLVERPSSTDVVSVVFRVLVAVAMRYAVWRAGFMRLVNAVVAVQLERVVWLTAPLGVLRSEVRVR